MNYWLTVHYPQVADGSDWHPLRVWLRGSGTESAGAALAVGDRVLVYETKGGPARRMPSRDGRTREVPVLIGQQGIITVAEVIGRLKQNPTFEKTEYADGTQRWWCWHAPLKRLHEDGYVPRVEVNHVLGFSPQYLFRGFGDKNSGLKRITREQYESLERLYLGQTTPLRETTPAVAEESKETSGKPSWRPWLFKHR